MEALKLFKVRVANPAYHDTYFVLAGAPETAQEQVEVREGEHGEKGFIVVGIERLGDIDGEVCNVVADDLMPTASVARPRRKKVAR